MDIAKFFKIFITFLIISLLAIILKLELQHGVRLFPQKKEQRQSSAVSSFNDLPQSEQEKYVNKEMLDKYGNYITPKSYLETYADDEKDKILTTSIKDLQTMVRDLTRKNKILAQDNVDMSRKNLDFMNEVSQIRDAMQKQKSELTQNASKELSELENRRTSDVEQLTKQLSEAQSDIIKSSKGYEQKILGLENELANIKGRNQNGPKLSDFNSNSDKNVANLTAKNSELRAQIELKDALIKELESVNLNRANQAQKEIAQLNAQIEQNRADIDTLAFLYRKETSKLKSGFELTRKNLESEIGKKSDEIYKLKSNLESNQTALNASIYELDELKRSLNNQGVENKKYSGLNLELNASLNTLKKSYDELKAQGLKDKEKLHISELEIENLKRVLEKSDEESLKFQKLSSDQNATISQLNERLARSYQDKKNALKELDDANLTIIKNQNLLKEQNATIAMFETKLKEQNLNSDELKKELEKRSDSMKILQANLDALKTELNATMSELDSKKQIAKVDNQNYQILHEQIISLEKERQNLASELAKSEANATIAILEAKISKANSENSELVKNINEKEAGLKKLQDDIKELKDELNKSALNYKALESNATALKAELKKSAISYKELESNATALKAKLDRGELDYKALENNASKLKDELNLAKFKLDMQKQSEQIDAQNYEILRAKIASLEAKSETNSTEVNLVLENFNKNIKILAEQNRTIGALERDLLSLKQSKNEIEKELKQAKINADEKIASLEALKSELKIKEQDKIKLESALKTKEHNQTKLESELKELNLKLKDTEAISSELIALKSELESKNSDITALKDRLKEQESENLNLKNKEINATAINLELTAKIAAINELKNSKDELETKLNINNLNLKALENNITALKDELGLTQAELERQREIGKNKEGIKDQITAIEKRIVGLILAGEKNATSRQNLAALKNELETAKKALKEHNKTIQRLNIKLATTQKNSNTPETIAQLQRDIEQNLNRQDALEDENTNLKMILETQTKSELPTKIVLISSITCEDMDAKGKVSLMCRNRVSEFLQRFSANYIYEVIPIVNRKNIVIPDDVAQNIKKDELGRLNNYVNYGVGKERAVAAAELIKDEFGDFARISFSSEVIVREVSRGFTIKVYR